MTELRHSAGPLAALGLVLAGIGIGHGIGPGPARLVIMAAVMLAAVAVWRRGRVGLVCAALACGFAACGATQRALGGLAVSSIGPLAEQRAVVTASVTLVRDPDPGHFGARAIGRISSVVGTDPHGAGRRLVLVTASGDVGSRLALLEAGDRVLVRGRLQRLAGFDARYRWRHAVARLAIHDILHVTGPHSVLPRLANPIRHLVLGGTRFLPPRERALVSGFLVGDTRGVPTKTTEEFRAAGLSHLLAVSGENVAFVVALVTPLLRRFGLRGRFLGGLAVLLIFGSVTRWEPSVLRAVAMASVSMLAIFLGRPTPALRVLVLAAIALLLADPFLVHSVGFLLSCGACIGLLLVGRPLERRLGGPESLRQPLAMTAAAQLGVLPIALATFGSLPLNALPANIAVAPVVGPLTVAGLIGGATGGVLARRAPDVASLCQLPARLLVGYVEAVASVASRIPLAVDGRNIWLAVALSSAAGAVVVAARRPGSVRKRCLRSVSATVSTTSGAGRS